MPARKITRDDLDVIDAIMSAYMACNSAGGPLEYEVSPEWKDQQSDPTAMGYLATAGRVAWQQIGAPASLWSVMVECGEDAAYVLNLHRMGTI